MRSHLTTKMMLQRALIALFMLVPIGAVADEPPGGYCGWVFSNDYANPDFELIVPHTAPIPLRTYFERPWNCSEQYPDQITISVTHRETDQPVEGQFEFRSAFNQAPVGDSQDNIQVGVIWTPLGEPLSVGAYTMKIEGSGGDIGLSGEWDLESHSFTKTIRFTVIPDAFKESTVQADIELTLNEKHVAQTECCEDGQHCWIEACRIELHGRYRFSTSMGEAPYDPDEFFSYDLDIRIGDAEPRRLWRGSVNDTYEIDLRRVLKNVPNQDGLLICARFRAHRIDEPDVVALEGEWVCRSLDDTENTDACVPNSDESEACMPVLDPVPDADMDSSSTGDVATRADEPENDNQDPQNMNNLDERPAQGSGCSVNSDAGGHDSAVLFCLVVFVVSIRRWP